MIPFKEKEKAVKTFVQNLRDGVVEMNLIELRRYRMATYYQGIIASIESLVKMSSDTKKSEY